MVNNNTRIILSAEDQTRAAFDSVSGGFGRMERASQEFNKTVSGGTSNAIRNASYQISDFIVQVQGGQGVMRSLSQQLPQLLAGFGTFGAVAGIVAGVLPSVITAFSGAEKEAQKLDAAVSGLNSAIGDVGKTERTISMDNLYKEYNKANAVTRQAIVDQLKFQTTLIDTQQIIANKSLARTLEGFGEYGFLDKLKGGFASTGAERLAQELGVSKALAADMLPAIRALKAGTGDATNFMQLFGLELAANTNPKAQQLLKDVRAVAEGTNAAYAAQSALSDATERMNKAGAGGLILLETEKSRLEELLELQKKRIAAINEKEAAMRGDEPSASVDTVSRQYEKAIADKAQAMADAHEARMEQQRIETEGEEAIRLHLEKTSRAIEKQQGMAKDLGFTFASAAEEAILKWESVGDVLRGLAQDVQRIFVRKTITEPMGESLSGLFKGFDFGKLFGSSGGSGGSFDWMPSFAGGGFTGGGSRSGGIDGQGGFLAMLHPNETVVDHASGGEGGGAVTIQLNFAVGIAQTVRAEVMAMMPQIQAATTAGMIDARRRGGAVRKAFAG